MNNTLLLKGTFEQAKRDNGAVVISLPKNKSVSSEKLKKILQDLKYLYNYWANDTTLQGALVSVYYNKIAAKSNRIQRLLSSANNSVRGARFYDESSPKHLITHYVSLQEIEQSIREVAEAIEIIDTQLDGCVSAQTIEKINSKNKNEKINLHYDNLTKTNFLKIVVDAYYVDRLDIFSDIKEFDDKSIITIFKTSVDTIDLMNKLGIRLSNDRIIDDTTLLLLPDEYNLLKEKAPYLISMSVTDLSELTKSDFNIIDASDNFTVPTSKNEPTIGVIDTLFSNNVYFSDWVESKNLLPKEIETSEKDYLHGTAVTSIIVDGPTLNPLLDDGCGRFKVKHFGVATNDKFSSFTILKNIERLVIENPEIKVWNLSLGSKYAVNQNFISPEAAILDKIQKDYDVIFVIAGTNKEDNEEEKRVGAPADSINSLIVNSVTSKGEPTKYTRTGPVLSFYIKPDIAYYGGDNENKIKVYTQRGVEHVQGTSFAAPWIARKICYLISVLGLSREEAKALIIHSSTNWEKQKFDPNKIGHGIVPIKIEDVLNTKNDEIQMIISGVSDEYNTYNYKLPVPVHNGKHPFIAKATVCYFPKCSRTQGVDYTNTELDIKFGRIKDNDIKSIDNNYQDTKGHYTWEKDARLNYRKWDNVKHIREVFTTRKRPIDSGNPKGFWGLSLKTKNRLNLEDGKNLRFSIVITLKELNGVNRIDDFVKNCLLNEWFVNRINVQHRVEIHNISEEEITFEE